MAVKYSRQREAIKSFIMDRKDHPTAETVYEYVRKEYPHISLGTVYRNLTLLANNGEINKVNVGDGVDHFDPNISDHMHFLCNSCGSLTDIYPQDSDNPYSAISSTFEGEVHGSVTYFYGKCKDCCEREAADKS